MQLTKEFIESLKEKDKEATNLGREISDKINYVKKTFSNREQEIERAGKKQTVKEKFLWEEVRNLGTNCEAYEELKKVYPDIFNLSEKQTVIIEDIEQLVITNLGFSFTSMKLVELIELIEAIVNYTKEKDV